jgi:hypothetical protein
LLPFGDSFRTPDRNASSSHLQTHPAFLKDLWSPGFLSCKLSSLLRSTPQSCWLSSYAGGPNLSNAPNIIKKPLRESE